MGWVRDRVSMFKEKARARETERVSREASKLAGLRKERIRLEGQRKVYATKAKEEARISKAKEQLKKDKFSNSPLGRASESLKKMKKKSGGKKKGFEPSSFGGESPFKLR